MSVNFKTIKAVLRSMRPKQWTKNALVLAGYIFSIGDKTIGLEPSMFWQALGATILFCVMSGAVYIMNDIADRDQDRLHPVKRHRPIASGLLGPKTAAVSFLLLAGFGLAGAYLLSIGFAIVLGSYFLLQVAYTLLLKKIGLVDVFVIAGGFVLRAVGGAVAIGVEFSPWLLLCASLLALFLALCKRRHEKVVLNGAEGRTRSSLDAYDAKLLDQLIAVASSSTIICYSLYTLWPDTVAKFDTDRLGLTIPFVIFGIFRYLDLVYRHSKGDRPEQILLTDGPLMIDIALYGICVLAVLL